MPRLFGKWFATAVVSFVATQAWAQTDNFIHGSFDDEGSVIVDPDTPEPPPPPPPGGDPVWVVLNGAQAGPFTVQELQGLISSGQMTGSSLVWIKGMPEWRPASEVQQVAALFGDTPPPPPPPDNDDPAAFLAGTWQGGPDPVTFPNGQQGTLVARYIFGEDGSLRAESEMTASAGGQQMTVANKGIGSFTASSAGDSRITIRPQVQITTSATGLAEQTSTWDQAFTVRVVDPDTIADETSGNTLRRAGGAR